MEISWIRKRAELRELQQQHPDWTDQQLAYHLDMSRSWVQKWRQRLAGTDPKDDSVLLSRSRARLTSPKQVSTILEAKVIHLRQTLSEDYHRRVGARTILYHLQHDPELQRLKVFVPRSTSTVHGILDHYHLIPRPAPVIHIPLDRPAPMHVWEIDFTDVSTAKSPDSEKRAHQVEVFNVIDSGTSILIASQASDAFDARKTLVVMIDVLDQGGCPAVIRFDRDPRLVASWTMDRFPSAFMRFLLCVGITPEVCPPHRPDRKPFVERFQRSQQEECIAKHRPPDVVTTQIVVGDYLQFYNLDRPNQALSCQNQPPSYAHLPVLPRLPSQVDPDGWLGFYHGRFFRRRVNSKGTVHVDKNTYYIGRHLRGQTVQLRLDAQQKYFTVWHDKACVKQVAIKGLYNEPLSLDEYVEMILQEAQSEERRLLSQRQRRAA